MHADRSGFTGQWTDTPMELNNEYFTNLFSETWVEVGQGASTQYMAVGRDGINALG